MPVNAMMRRSRFPGVSAVCLPTCIMARCHRFESPDRQLHSATEVLKSSWMNS